jgi:membrane-bound serine protease (ClpP class)
MVPTISLVGGFFVVVAGLVFRSRTRRPMTGESGLIGETGVVKTPLTPAGRIQVHGELWFARCRTPLAAGQRVRVTAVDGLTLEVEPAASAAGPKGITP